MKKPSAGSPVEINYLKLLIKGHWEFQEIAKDFDLLKQTWTKRGNLERYFKAAAPLLGSLVNDASGILTSQKYNFFWHETQPAKWKYSDDNLIITKK